MHLRSFILILLVSLVGCASSGSRMSVEEWFNQEAQRWVDAVNNSCDATHQNFIKSQSPVDCNSKPPDELHMSFPNKPFFVRYEMGIGEYLNAWCVAVMNRHENSPSVKIELRKEAVTHSLPCPIILQKVREARP